MNRPISALCVIALLLAGCRQPASDQTAGTSAASDADKPVPASPATPGQGEPLATAPAAAAADSAGRASAASNAEPAEPEIPTLRIATVDGKQFDLAAHRGKWVVVNFWATWCAPCRKEMPELSALDAMRENIDVVGLAYEDIEPADMAAFLQKHPVVYPIAILDVMAPPKDFATPRGLPMTYLIAPDGNVAKKFLGPVTAADIESLIPETPRGQG